MLTLARKHGLGTVLVLFCLSAFGTQFLIAESSKAPTTWWPDPTTGLMWTGQTIPASWTGHRMNWQEAKDYCASLQFGGYSGWRLPTLDEIKAITYYQSAVSNSGDPYEALVFKGRIPGPYSYIVWTSTMSGVYEAWAVDMGNPLGAAAFNADLLAEKDLAICARPMAADLFQIAKDAQVSNPVPDVLTLKANVPLNKARLAYQTGNFKESITQAKNALLIKADFAQTYWGIGISYGMLGQWDLAITNLETALKIDKNYGDAKDALKWAQQGRKAAKDGKSPKAQSPQWN